MNILITYIETGSPKFICGVKSVSSILGKEWQKEGHSVQFMTFICNSDLRLPDILGIKQTIFPNLDVIDCVENQQYFIKYVKDNKIEVILHQFADSEELTRLCAKVKKETGVKLISTLHFSITHLNDIAKEMFFVKYRLGSNPINYLCDTLLWGNYWLRNRKKIAKENRRKLLNAYNLSDKVVVLSDKYIPIFEKEIDFRDRDDKLVAINNPSVLSNQVAINRDKEKRVLWCGRVEFGMKRVDRMMRIWKRVSQKFPDWQLDVLGSGDIDYFSNLAKKYGIKNINFVGFCNPQDYYDRGAILCMTSSTEGWGMVLVEAQSNRVVPMVYNSYASATDIIDDGDNGFLVKAFDEDEYVEKLMLLMRDDDMRLRMAESAMVSVRKFDSRKIAEQWIDLFRKC